MPATGTIARTVTNVKSGATSPVAGMVHALALLLIMLAAAPLAGKIPLACLAGILLVVAYNMSEWRSFLVALKGNRYDAAVLLVDDVDAGIEFGGPVDGHVVLLRVRPAARAAAGKVRRIGERRAPRF